jgi:hypothetical protein
MAALVVLQIRRDEAAKPDPLGALIGGVGPTQCGQCAPKWQHRCCVTLGEPDGKSVEQEVDGT